MGLGVGLGRNRVRYTVGFKKEELARSSPLALSVYQKLETEGAMSTRGSFLRPSLYGLLA
jgi:Na+-transporting NADH:ubiquinone oxidoreductase subunit NqrD